MRLNNKKTHFSSSVRMSCPFLTIFVILLNTGNTIFTARVRSTTGRYCFYRCLSVNICGVVGRGGVPHPRSGVGRYHGQAWMVGGTRARSGWWGVPHPRSGVGRYHGQAWMVGVVPHPRCGGVPWTGLDGGGYPIPGVGGVPWPGLDGGGVPRVPPPLDRAA